MMTKAEMKNLMKVASAERLYKLTSNMVSNVEYTLDEMQVLIGDDFLSKKSLRGYFNGNHNRKRFSNSGCKVEIDGVIAEGKSKKVKNRYVNVDNPYDVIETEKFVCTYKIKR